MRCGRCGNENAEGNRFCGMCGTALVPKTADPVKVAAQPVPEAPGLIDPMTPTAPPRSREIFSQPEPEPPQPETFITGPSFLGLGTPGPGKDRGSQDTHSPASGNLDYLLEDDEEEPKRGWGKFILVIAGLILAAGFGYLHWKQGGFDWLNASNKPAASTPDSSPAGPSQPSTPNATNPGSTTAAPPGTAPNPAESVPGQATPSQNSGTPASTVPNDAAPESTAPEQNTSTQSPSGDVQAPADFASPAATSGFQAGAPAKTAPAPKARTHKPAPTKSVPAKSVPGKPSDSVAEAERYIYGRGIAQDCDRGLHLLKPAAEQFNPQAMISLAALYSTGTCTPRDLPTAYRWFALALHKQPDNQILQDDLKSLWAKMTPPERQLAIKLSQ